MNFVVSNKDKKDIFVSLFQVLKSCSTLINCNFESEFLHIQGMDKSHVCLYDVKITKAWFDKYNVDSTTKLCFDTNVFHSIISIKSDNQDLIVKTEEDTLHVQFINTQFDSQLDSQLDATIVENNDEQPTTKKSKKKVAKKEVVSKVKEKNDFKKIFKMPLAEYEYEEMNIPLVDYDAEFSFSSKLAADMFSQLSNFGNDINFACSEETIHLTTTSITGEMCVQIPIDDLLSYSIVEGDKVVLNYSLSYLNKMCITNKLSQEIEFSLSNDCPMKIAYPLGEESFILFYMAPKIID
jgi:proliferating cell nuclear antigen